MLTTRWADDLVKRADDLDPHDREKAQFYLRQVTAALSPSNFLATNPELLRTTLAESGENLVRGLKMLAEDIDAGPWQFAHSPVGRARVQARRQHGGDAGQSGLPQCADRAHPVRADHARRLQAPAAHRAAVDQQVLRPRPQSREVVHPLGGRAGADRVRHLLGQSRRAPRRQGFRQLYARGRSHRPRLHRAGDRRTRGRGDRLLRRRHAARRDARLHGGGSATSGS